jgi:hypothetical protein
VLDDDCVLALLLDGDDVTGTDLIGRDVHLLPVDLEVPVVDELPGLGTGSGETGAPDDVVQPLLEELEEVVTGDAGTTGCLRVVTAELPFEDAVHGAELLLLAELDQIVALPDPAAAVLSGGIGATVDRASLRLAQRGARPATCLVTGAGVTSHQSLTS